MYKIDQKYRYLGMVWSEEVTRINVWTEPLRLNLSGPGNGRVTYLSRFPEPIPKNSL